MRTYTCDFCEKDMVGGVSFRMPEWDVDICNDCLPLMRKAVCPQCKGSGKMKVVDLHATNSQASCGENRTQYKKIKCEFCCA